MLNTQKFLTDLTLHRAYTIDAALAQLTAETGIKVKDYYDFVLLDYDQIESPKSDPRVIECRSLILEKNDGFAVLSRKFDRFFNAGECPEYYADFQLDHAVVMEKADGSLIGVWYNRFDQQWEISTRGMAKAEGEHMMGGTFRDHVISAMGFNNEDEFQHFCDVYLSRYKTFVMEFCSPQNRIVTKYDTPHMVLLGVSNTLTEGTNSEAEALQSLHQHLYSAGMNIRMPKFYDPKATIAELISDANALPDLQEGFVLYDRISGKRMKIKSSTYVTAHRLRGNDPVPTRKNMLELVLTGEVDEFLVYFPEWSEMIKGLQAEVEQFLVDADTAYTQNVGIESQKDFALAVKDFKFSALLFSARKLIQTPRHIFKEMNYTTKAKYFL